MDNENVKGFNDLDDDQKEIFHKFFYKNISNLYTSLAPQNTIEVLAYNQYLRIHLYRMIESLIFMIFGNISYLNTLINYNIVNFSISPLLSLKLYDFFYIVSGEKEYEKIDNGIMTFKYSFYNSDKIILSGEIKILYDDSIEECRIDYNSSPEIEECCGPGMDLEEIIKATNIDSSMYYEERNNINKKLIKLTDKLIELSDSILDNIGTINQIENLVKNRSVEYYDNYKV